jgi:Flp pilus assembly protein TadG
VRRLSPRHPLSRLREERGGIAVMLALLMPVLFGAAAIALDTAAVWSARQQVENGADAAVIAVAMDCARNQCSDMEAVKQTATEAFFANNRAAKLSNLGSGEGNVSVNGRQVSVEQTRPWVVNHFFAAALGQGTGELSVQSYAEWAPAASANADVPLGISLCTYRTALASSPPTATLPLSNAINTTTTCAGPTSGSAAVPSGQALSVPDSGSCRTQSARGQNVPVPTSSASLGSCTSTYFTSLVGRDIWLPVWDAATQTSAPSPTFRVYGYAAFRVTAFNNATSPWSLSGRFVLSARQSGATTPPDPTTLPALGAPDLGARSVYLTKD